MGNPGGSPFVLASGLGSPFIAWFPLLSALPSRFLFVSWDYRGFYRSPLPSHRPLGGVIENARDLLALLQGERFDEVLLAGWSMGVQVVLELYRLAPERVKGLIFICGSYKNPFRSLPFPPERVATGLAGFLQRFPEIPEKAFYLLRNFPPALLILRSIGAISPRASRDLLVEVLKEMESLDFARYFEVLSGLREHSAEDLLQEISVPVLVIAGEKDPMIPQGVARDFQRKIPHAELLIVPGGTHYAPVEEPFLIARGIEGWIARNRLG
jgi:pimeloyl-ACP methyl ester carboxylesterase